MNWFFIAVAAYKAESKISTHITHKATIHTLRDYVQSENLMFQDITPEFLAKYEKYLKGTIKIKTNTIYKHLKFLENYLTMHFVWIW